MRYSTGFRNAIAAGYGWRDVLKNCVIKIYSGTQPTTADSAATGTLLGIYTPAGGAFTGETRATATVQLTGGAGGSVDTVKVGGGLPLIGAAVPFNTSLTQTALDLADAINAFALFPKFEAVASGDTVTISAPKDLGTMANGLTIASTSTTITTADVAFSGGVDAVNGCLWKDVASGVIYKEDTVWQFTGLAAGTRGWFRIECDGDDDQALSTVFARADGSCSTSGGDMNSTTLAVALDGVYTMNTFGITIPAE